MPRFNLNVHSAADPRYISTIVVDRGPSKGTESKKRVTHFYPRVFDLDALDAVRKGVFETNELLEQILLFLPAKNIFGVRRVSKQWNAIVDSSVGLQQKMFLRPRDEPELWTVDDGHKVGANDFCQRRFQHLKHLVDTELKFRRMDHTEKNKRRITPITLNPMLQNNDPLVEPDFFRTLQANHEYVSFHGWMDAFKHSNASFWNTYITDPPCHEAVIPHFILYFGQAPLPKHYPGYEYWVPVNAPYGDEPPEHPSKSHPISASVVPSASAGEIKSDDGIKMGDVLQECLTSRGEVYCKFSDNTWWSHDDATIHEAIDVVKEKLASEGVPSSPYMTLLIRLGPVGWGPNGVLLATEEERAAANANRKELQ